MTVEQKYIQHVEQSFANAEKLQSKVNQEIIDMDGMTGRKTRHLYNNLLSMEDARYLEIGVWKGSSSCAALCGNKSTAVLMDDFSGFGGPIEEFMANFEKYRGENEATFFNQDCFKIDIELFKNKFNIYLFDADHSEASQYKALEYYLPCMDDVFIFIIDDWNWSPVRTGTMKAIADNNLSVVWSKEIKLTDNDEFTPDPELAKNEYWNGIAIFILKK